MNFKKINNYFFLLLLPLFSCSQLENIKKENTNFIDNIDENIESNNIIDISINPKYNEFYDDFYQPIVLDEFDFDKKISKIKTFNLLKKNYFETRPLIAFSYKDKFIFLNHESILNIYDLNTLNLLNTFELQYELDNNSTYPTSISRINDNFFVSYSNGTIISFDINGNLLWTKSFNDIIKTPIKIVDNNLIILLSDKIVSINSSDGNINWNFKYENNTPLQALGGDILNWNNLLFFILPNNRVGSVDTIFGEKNKTSLLDIYFNDSINNSFDKIHTYNNYLSYFDEKEYLSTIDLSQNSILLDKKKIHNVKSFVFFNNTLIVLDKNLFLKSYNIQNGKLFWKQNISEIIKDNDNLISVATSNKSLIIFFESGNFLKFNYLNGLLISSLDIKLKNILKIRTSINYIEIYHKNGKFSLLEK